MDGLGLPNDEFDYDRFVAEEFGEGQKNSRRQWVWWLAAVVLLLALALSMLGVG